MCFVVMSLLVPWPGHCWRAIRMRGWQRLRGERRAVQVPWLQLVLWKEEREIQLKEAQVI